MKVERTQEVKPAQSYLVIAVIVVALGIACAFTQCKVPSILPALSAQFGMDLLTESMMMSAFTLMGIFFSVPASLTIQRLGAKRVMVWSTSIMVIGSLLGTFAPSTNLLIVSRAIEGIALIFITIAGIAFIRENSPPERLATAMGIWSVWYASGAFLASIISPIIYNNLGFKALWLIYAAFSVVAALAVRFVIKAPNVVLAEVFPSAKKPRYRELLTKNIILLMLVFAIYNLMTMSVIAYLPSVLQSQGIGESLSGLISTVPMLISIISAPVLGIISDRIRRVKPLMSGAFLVLVITTPTMFLASGWQLWAAAIVCGLLGTCGAALATTALLVLLPRVELAPLALGAFTTTQALGMFAGSLFVPFLLGPGLANLLSTAVVLWTIGFIGFILSLLCRYR